MRLSEIGDKEIADLSKGSLHGKLWDAEMLFEELQTESQETYALYKKLADGIL